MALLFLNKYKFIYLSIIVFKLKKPLHLTCTKVQKAIIVTLTLGVGAGVTLYRCRLRIFM